MSIFHNPYINNMYKIKYFYSLLELMKSYYMYMMDSIRPHLCMYNNFIINTKTKNIDFETKFLKTKYNY